MTRPRHHRASSNLVVRLAVAGMALAVVGLGALALWGAIVTQNGASKLTSAGVQTTGHLRAVQALSMIDNLTDALEDEYDPRTRADLDGAVSALDGALVRMQGGGVAQTTRMARDAAPVLRRLKAAIDRFVIVRRSGSDDAAEEAEDVMEDHIEEMEGLVHRLDVDPSVTLTHKLEGVRDSLATVRRWALVLVPLGLAFVGAAAWMLRAYRRRTEEAMRSALETSAVEARTDQLTGIANRRALFEELDAAMAAGESLVLATADLNGFKQYNDTYGHPAGDALLRRLAGRLSVAFVGRGTAARLGGDEFCVLVRGATDEEDVQERVRHALSERGEGFSITASCGTVAAPRDASGTEALLRIADERMYGAKSSSRPGVDSLVSRALLRMLDERHPGLARHLEDVADLASGCAAALGLPAEECAAVHRAAELHDIGKVGIPTSILIKPDRLTDEEWEFMRRHTLIGERILASVPSLHAVAAIVRSSHERWDGRGYPDALAAADIPLAARIVAVTDAFCAMTEDRPYALARPVEHALAELQACAGSQFDPQVVAAFVKTLRGRRPAAVAA